MTGDQRTQAYADALYAVAQAEGDAGETEDAEAPSPVF